MRGLFWVLAGMASIAVAEAGSEMPGLLYPQVQRFGGIVRVPAAAEPPRRGAKVVFDITADGKSGELNKGLESVARYLNLNADAGLKRADARLALVLHGAATKVALSDIGYAKHTDQSKNPNLELILALKACGVEVYVCGQSLARHSFSLAEVADNVTVAASAMTVNANKQQDGYAYIALH